eukprot:NODE_10272_length_1364_cov_7.151172.p1 GENE.NODE_10272_length_1364_cov_7.151172~~NODE_10272_length_1364_cov_7.151172.p1  ORF type:complete len:333 (+),score=74.01 NODE_10272_length_1364_cov_7.151172:119-1000(+)
MEDAVDVLYRDGVSGGAPPLELYCVYDGHNGTETVEFVRRQLPRALEQRAGLGVPGGVARARVEELVEAFWDVDKQLIAQFQQNVPPHATHRVHEPLINGCVLSSGCVACLAAIEGNAIRIVHLGDCRALICEGGDIRQLTSDHNPEGNELERQRLRELGVHVSTDGYIHGRIGVSRAFGNWEWCAQEKCRGVICRPDVIEAEVTPDTEFLVLACDGIFEKMTAMEVGQIVRRRLRATGSAREAAEALVKHATKRCCTDNITALVVFFRQPPSQDIRGALETSAAPHCTPLPG